MTVFSQSVGDLRKIIQFTHFHFLIHTLTLTKIIISNFPILKPHTAMLLLVKKSREDAGCTCNGY